MTKDELINAVVKTCKDDNLTKRLAGDVVDAAFENISKAIKKEKRFAYPSFGTFTVRARKARKGRKAKRLRYFQRINWGCRYEKNSCTI